MSTDLYPLTLEPVVVEQARNRAADPVPDDDALPPGFTSGTLWMATDASRVAAGPQAGRSLGYLRQLWGPELVGRGAGGDLNGPLPVELKLKRTGEAALAVGLAEDSLWHFLAADEGSSVQAGFTPGLDFARAAAAAGDDPGRWSEFMPEYEVEPGRSLWLPRLAPLVLGAGLTVAQISPPGGNLFPWPLDGSGPEALRRAAESGSPVWLPPGDSGAECAVIYRDQRLAVSLITTAQLPGLASPDATTFLWPLQGQGRIRARGPAPATRLQPGRVVMMPAALGRYTIESGGLVSYLLIEAF